MSNPIKYKLPEQLRDSLKEPIGFLFNEQELFEYIEQSSQRIVSVGDLVTFTLLKNDINPLFCIIDQHTRRQDLNESKIKRILSYGSQKIHIKNPAGTITEELYDCINDLFEHNKSDVLIIVDGEEDLASLIAILLAPSDVTIIYGMPDKGVVVVPATVHHKQKVQSIIAQM